jgi:hypothetical protein
VENWDLVVFRHGVVVGMPKLRAMFRASVVNIEKYEVLNKY